MMPSSIGIRNVTLLAMAAGLLFQSQSLAAQAQGTITGVVIDAATLRPMSSVQVHIPSVQMGTLTNDSGRFLLLNVASGVYTLRAEQVGYGSVEQSVTVSSGQTLTVNLELSTVAIDLGELVVSIDAVAARRMEFGTDIERFDAGAEVEKGAITSMSDLLSGRAAGVDIQRGSGPIGSASRIRVRGVTSLTQGSNPLIIIDGIRSNNQTNLGPESIDWT